MADGLQSFNVPPTSVQSMPNLYSGLTAPANYGVSGPVPQFSSPALPPRVDYSAAQTPQPSPQDAGGMPSPGALPPPFPVVLQNLERNLGRKLTPEEFDGLTNDYKTNYAVPALNTQFKGKKANVEAEVAAFDNQIAHLRSQLYANQTDDSAHKNGLMNFLGAAGTEAFNSTALGTLSFGAKALGGITSLGGNAPNAVSDALFKYGVDPNTVASGKTDIQAGQDFAKLILGHNYGDPAYKDLQSKLESQGGTNNSNVIGIGGAEKKLSDYAQKTNPYGAITGDVLGLVAQALLLRKLGKLPELPQGAGRLATFGQNVVEQAPLAEKIASGQATSNQNRGDSQADVLKQFGVDLPANLVFMGMPGSVSSASKIVRAATGAGIGAGQTLAQQNLDAAVNPNNPEPSIANKESATQIGLQALLAVLLGGKGNVLKKSSGEPTPDTGAAPESQQAPTAEAGAPLPTDGARPTATPIDMFKAVLDTAPETGIEQPAFIKLQASALEKANAQAKKYKSEIQTANTPEKVVQGATALAERFTGKQWASLNADQRSQTIETLAAWLGKKTKVPAEDISAHIEMLRNPPAPEGVIPPVAEQPLPADITGQQVPGTAAQETASAIPSNKAADIANVKNMSKGISDSFYDGLWDTLSGGPKASDAFKSEKIYPALKAAVQAGKITSRDQLKELLLKAAQTKQTKNNVLKAKPLAPTPDAEAGKKAVADTVTEALTDKSTPETQRNKLKAAVKTQTEKQYNQAYLRALANRDNAPSDAAEAALRQDPLFNSAADALRQGKINTPEDLGRFLKEQKGTATVGDALAGHETKQVGALLGNKSTKSDIVQARKAVRANIVDPLIKLGEDKTSINKMTVGEATAHLQKLANTFTETPTPKKGLKKANVEPIDNPDEPTPPPKKSLKKTNVQPVEKPTKGKTKPPKAQAPAENAGATPLESQLRERFGNTLPQKRIDALHDAISEARMGDSNKLKDEIEGLQSVGELNIGPKEVKWLKSLAKEEPLNDLIHDRPESANDSRALRISSPRIEIMMAKRLDPLNHKLHEAKLNLEKASTSSERLRLQNEIIIIRDKIDSVVRDIRAADRADAKQQRRDGPLHNRNTKRGSEEPLNDLIENNASGESSASLEAQRRLADERSKGQTRAIIRRDGSVEPLTGVDAVDTHARTGEVVVQRGVGKADWTILSHGDDLTRDTATGKLNRASEELNNTHEMQRRPSLDEVEALNDARTKDDKAVGQEPDRIAPVQVKRRVKAIVDEVREGADVRETGRKLQKLHDDIEQASMESKLRDAVRPERRGVEYVRARLQKMVADHTEGDDHYEAGKFGLWLLDKNPNLANYLAIRIRKLGKDGEGASGQFNPGLRLIHINSADTNPGTVVHEVLHSAEQLMPNEIQNKLRGEYVGRLQNKIKQVIKTGNKTAQRYLELALQDYVHPSAEARKEMSLLMRTDRKNIPYDEFYKYSNPSEYLAIEGTNILNRRYMADSWIAKMATWLQEYWQHAKGMLGFDGNSQVIKAVNEALKTSGTEYNPKMVRTPRKSVETGEVLHDELAKQEGENPTDEELGYESAKDADVDPNMQKEAPVAKAKSSDRDLGAITKSQHFIEHYMSADYGLEKMMQGARKLGIKVTEKNNVENAAYAKNGLQSEFNNKDIAEAYDPSENWMYANADKFAKNTADMLDKTNKFFHNKHWLERGYTSWYMESPLGFKGALDRADILEQVETREITGTEARKQLIALANKEAQYKPEEWMTHEGMPVDTLKDQLKKLATENGVDEKSFGELNSLMDLARQRQRQRLIDAGKFAEDDPYIDLYGWKWYVPLKGSAYGSDTNNFDLVPTKYIALGRLNAQMKAMEGRSSFAERPFSRLFVDMVRAGSAQADSHVKNTAYELVTDLIEKKDAELTTRLAGVTDKKERATIRAEVNKEYGEYSIHAFEGGYKEGYTNTKTGEKIDRLKAPMNGIIVNDGNTHYVITMPKDSQLLRGLIKMNEVEKPNAVESFISHPTNALARLYTTMHPGWQTFSGFVRDLTYIPLTDAVTNHTNPIEAMPTWAKYSGNVLQAYKALPTLIPHLLASNPKALKALGLKTPRQMGEADPTSWAGWTRRYEAAGGANYFTQGFDVAGMEKLMQGRLKDVDGILDATKWGWKKALEYTGNYANFLEGISRVAMFKTKVEMGMSETQAAVETRKLLDYSKSGLKGRRINSWLAFFRVAMTGADAMRRAFTKSTGGLDYKKMATWQGFMGSLGAMGYMAFVAMVGEDKAKQVNPNMLTQKLLFPLGDKIAGVNLGLGLPQVLMAPGILMAAVQNGHVTPEKAMQLYMDTLARNGPISPAGNKDNTPTNFLASYILGFTPTIARPIVDVSRNTNTFNSSIHRDPSSGTYPSDSGRTNTPKVFKEMAQWLADATDHKVDYAPEDIRYFIQNYGGQWATDFVKAATDNPEVAAGAVDSSRMGSARFLVDTSHYMQNQMYDTLDQLQDSRRRYSSIVSRAKDNGATDQQAKAQANQIVSRDPKFKTELQAYRALDGARKDYQQKVNALRTNKLMSDTRKQLVRKQLDTQMRTAIEKAQASISTE